MTIRVGVVGLKHGMASVVEVARDPRWKLVALCNRSREPYDYLLGAPIAEPLDSVTFTASRESLIAEARQHCDFAGVRFYDDYDHFLADPDLDAVILAVPIRFNAPYAMKALASGKHVLASKPFAIDLDEARALRRAIRAAKGRFVVNFEFRYSPLFAAIRDAVASGKIGRMRLMSWNMFRMPFRPTYRSRSVSGGPFVAEICHWVDLFRMMEGRGRFVQAASFGGLGPMAGKQDFPDHAASILQYESGVVGSINFTYFTDYPEHNVFAFVGDEGKITGNTDGAGSYALFSGGNRQPARHQIDPDAHHQGHLGFDRSHGHFADVIERDVNVNAEEADAGFESAVSTIALDRAMNERRLVSREEVLGPTGDDD